MRFGMQSETFMNSNNISICTLSLDTNISTEVPINNFAKDLHLSYLSLISISHMSKSNFPTYIEVRSSDAPSIRLLYSDIDISWESSLLVYRMKEEAEREELFNMKLQARVRRLLMKRQKTDRASSSYCQETTATATNESSIQHCRSC